jgi:hypothetical protein
VPFYEDIHFAFVEYSGANLTHLSYLDNDGINADRLCGEMLIVLDADDSVDPDAHVGKKGERFDRLVKVLTTDRVIRLDCREIENALAGDVLRKIVAEYEGQDGTLKSTPDFRKYKTERLGHYIDGLLVDVTKSKRYSTKLNRAYADTSGTLRDKVAFADRAISHIQSWDDLTPSAKILTERIYAFILSKNAPPSPIKA